MPKFNRGDIITFDQTNDKGQDSLYLRGVGGEDERLLVTDIIYHMLNGVYDPTSSAYKLLWLNKGQDTQLSVAYADLKYKLVS